MSKMLGLITDAFDGQEERAARAKGNKRAATEKRVLRALFVWGIPDGDAEISGDIVKFSNDLVIRMVNNSAGSIWQVRGTCAGCGETCWSHPCYGLAGIGKMYYEFEPADHFDHCAANQPPDHDRLESSIRDIVIGILRSEGVV